MSENPELFQNLLNEYEEIRSNLIKELSGEDKATFIYGFKTNLSSKNSRLHMPE